LCPPLEPLACLARLAPSPGVGDGRPYRESGHHRPVPADAHVLAARGPDDGTTDHAEHRTPDLHPDPHVRAPRPENLAPRRTRGRAARAAPFRDLVGPLPSAPPGDGLAWARVGERCGPTDFPLQLRCDDPTHPRRRLRVRSLGALPA